MKRYIEKRKLETRVIYIVVLHTGPLQIKLQAQVFIVPGKRLGKTAFML